MSRKPEPAELPEEGYHAAPHPCGGTWCIVVDSAGKMISEHRNARLATAKVRRLNRKLFYG